MHDLGWWLIGKPTVDCIRLNWTFLPSILPVLPVVYRCLYGLAPWYLSDCFQMVANCNQRRLRSSSLLELVIRCTWLYAVSDCAFRVAGSRLWNSLPRDVTSAPTLAVVQKCLKSHRFSQLFPPWLLLAVSTVHYAVHSGLVVFDIG